MSETGASPRLALPLLAAGQAEKELLHNEALMRIDLALPAAAEAMRDDPPANPATGGCWLVGAAPTGAWAGRAGQLAGWGAAGWRFVDLPVGSRAAIGGVVATRIVTGWKFPPPLAGASGGSVVDAEARAVLDLLLQRLKDQGLIGG